MQMQPSKLYIWISKPDVMKNLLCCVAIAALSISCKKELEVQQPMYSSKDTATGSAPQAPAMPTNAQPVQQAQTMQVTPEMLKQGQKVAPGMNPAHGQPGHRCDIAVGAPLNSPVAKGAAKPSTQVATVTPSAPVKTAPGMNPSHGQPGHRCDIAVGAPLSSAPAKTEAAAAPVDAIPAILAPPAEEGKE